MKNDTIILLSCTWKESWNIYQRNNRNVKCIQETNETSTLTRRVAIQTASQLLRLICNNTYRLSIHAGKTYNKILGKVRLNFQELSIIYNTSNNLIHVVWHVRILWDNLIQIIFHAVNRISAFYTWSLFKIILWDIAKQLLDKFNCFFIIRSSKMSNTRFS